MQQEGMLASHSTLSLRSAVVNKKEITMTRYGAVIKIKPESIEKYRASHADVWPAVLAMIRQCNIRNYSIYLKDDYLFGYFEYHGTDFQADMAKMAADPKTQEWWAIMEPMQQPLESRKPGEWWAAMDEVFHMD
jgi:L-rhamnose mutarotase